MSGDIKDLKKKPEGYFGEERKEMLTFIPDSAGKILDVGCGEAVFSSLVKQKTGAEVWGIEIDKKAASIAERKIDRVISGSFEALINDLPDKYFDCIVFNDILEHMADPYSMLLKIKNKLAEEGFVVSSIPNVLYISVLKNVFFKKNWKYEPFGVLDKTHLRFFTKKSIINMFADLDYEIIKIKGINPSNSLKYWLFNIITLGYFRESNFLQFAVVAKPKK